MRRIHVHIDTPDMLLLRALPDFFFLGSELTLGSLRMKLEAVGGPYQLICSHCVVTVSVWYIWCSQSPSMSYIKMYDCTYRPLFYNLCKTFMKNVAGKCLVEQWTT